MLNFEIGFSGDLAGRETQIRELIDNEFNQVIFAVDTQGYTKQDKIEVMKNIIADIEKCIGIIEKDENARRKCKFE